MTPLPAALVRPGTIYTYEWTVPVDAGPVQGEADCLTYLYYSGVDPVKDTHSGLMGPLLICRPGSLKKGVQVRSLHKIICLIRSHRIVSVILRSDRTSAVLGQKGILEKETSNQNDFHC